MNNLLKKAFAENNVEYILLIDPDRLHDLNDQKLVKCVHKHKEVCAVKILQTFGKDLMLYYMEICTNYDKKKYEIETVEYLRKYHDRSELYEIDSNKDRVEEINNILKSRGHEFLIDKKSIKLDELLPLFMENLDKKIADNKSTNE